MKSIIHLTSFFLWSYKNIFQFDLILMLDDFSGIYRMFIYYLLGVHYNSSAFPVLQH